MSYSKQSSMMGGAPLYSPQSTLVSGSTAIHADQTPSTENCSGPLHPNAVVPVHRGSGYDTEDCINDIRQLCKESQGRVQALSQAIGRQPGMPSSLTDLLNNDLRVIAQQFATITYYCRMLEKRVEDHTQSTHQERTGERVSHDVQLNTYRQQLHDSRNRIARLEQDIRDIEQGHANADKRRRVELEKKKEKIDNQKRRIKEQQDQIDNLKKKASDGSKSSKTTKSKNYDDSSPEPAFPHSATSEFGADRSTPPFPEPKYSSTLDGKDEEFLLSNLKKLNTDFGPSGYPYPPPPTGATRMERDNHMHHGTVPPYHSYGQYGPPMPSVGPMGPMGPMNGALAPYGAFNPMNPYGPPMPNFGRPPMPPNGHAPSFHGYASPSYRGPGKYGQSRSASHSARGSDSHHSNALVLRRNDDSEFDPETKVWKDMFFRLFTGVNGWTHTFGAKIIPGAVEEATKNNPKLWDYILKVATCYKDANAAPKHALFMLNSPEHRPHFISRLMLQYMEQEMLHPKFWLGWDDETDIELRKVGPIIDFIGYPLEQRRTARQQLRTIVEGIAKDEEYSRFRAFKTNEHAKRLKDIVGPFVSSPVAGTDASVGLLSVANTAMEISHKIMASRLSFAYTWNECAVKFSHDSHIALNSDLNGLALQHKHTRICLVVTPSISYRDDNGFSIVPRGVTKAQVLVMN